MYNLLPVLQQMDDLQSPSSSPDVKARVTSSPCLPLSLPSTSFLQREADQAAPRAIIKQLRRSPTPPSPDAIQEALLTPLISDSRSSAPPSPVVESPSFHSALGSKGVRAHASWKDPQPYEVLRAVERKDIVYLMEVRDHAFHLLVRRSGGVTPLLHAMRIGKSHRDVAIILIGAFSRFVNHLEDDAMVLPRTKVILKAIRSNLKLAIDYGLQSSQSDLIASFLQTLVMSEGEKWILAQISNVGTALRAGTSGQPVQTAQNAVRSFATKELGKAHAIATLEDYIANSTSDLLMMAAWSLTQEAVSDGPIPTWYFARDDRVCKAFCSLLDQHQGNARQKLTKRLRWQIRVLRAVLEGRQMSWRSKVNILIEELDTGEGI